MKLTILVKGVSTHIIPLVSETRGVRKLQLRLQQNHKEDGNKTIKKMTTIWQVLLEFVEWYNQEFG